MTRCNAGLLVFAMVVGLLQAVGCDKRPGSAGTSGADAKAAGPANSATADAKPSGAPVSGGLLTAQDVLEKMAAAYKNASSYEDFGSLEFRQEPTQERSETRVNFSVAFQRPNKLRVELFNGKVICDGKQWYATCELVPGQAVLREAPAKLSLDILRADYWLYSALSDGEQFTSPQLQLLLDNDPIKSLVAGSQEVALDEPGRLGDYDCYRVRVGFARRPGVLVDRSEDVRVADVGRADRHRAAAVRGRGTGQPHLAGDQFRACPPWRRYRSEGLPVRHRPRA